MRWCMSSRWKMLQHVEVTCAVRLPRSCCCRLTYFAKTSTKIIMALVRLVAYGAQDSYLTSSPDITFFKTTYTRCTSFIPEFEADVFERQIRKIKWLPTRLRPTVRQKTSVMLSAWMIHPVDLPMLRKVPIWRLCQSCATGLYKSITRFLRSSENIGEINSGKQPTLSHSSCDQL